MQELMNATDIAFPNLHIYLTDMPKNFTVFGFSIAFYGVLVGLGILSGVLLAAWQAKRSGLNPEVIWDFSLYAVIVSIIGARLYYVIFMWDSYKDDLLSIFNLRGGGLAIYGGVIAAFITAGVFCHVKKISFRTLVDCCTPGLILGQAIGRWGNFMNREVFGQYTENIFAMRLPIDAVRPGDISDSLREHIAAGTNYIQVHPTFLYESMWNLFLAIALVVYQKHKRYRGEIAVLYLGGYGLGRFFIEGIRTDRLYIMNTNLAVSQLLAGLLVLFSVGVEIVWTIYHKKHSGLTSENGEELEK